MRPIFIGGNSDGDFEMLEWATAGDGPRLGLIVHHTDVAREWACDSESHSGKLVRGLKEGPGRGWLIVDMTWMRTSAASSSPPAFALRFGDASSGESSHS